MIPKATLQRHYAEYAGQPDAWVENMEATKRSILAKAVEKTGFKPRKKTLKAVVLGASDPRYILIHQRIMEQVTGKKIQLAHMDIDAAHLGGKENGVIEHDVTKEFPEAPYDLIMSHELMKFLTPEEQLAALKNAHHALANGGLALHIVHDPAIQGTAELRNWQNRVDPDALVKALKRAGINAEKHEFESESDVDWLRHTTVIAIRGTRKTG